VLFVRINLRKIYTIIHKLALQQHTTVNTENNETMFRGNFPQRVLHQQVLATQLVDVNDKCDHVTVNFHVSNGVTVVCRCEIICHVFIDFENSLHLSVNGNWL